MPYKAPRPVQAQEMSSHEELLQAVLAVQALVAKCCACLIIC